jgi:hypothetical protein
MEGRERICVVVTQLLGVKNTSDKRVMLVGLVIGSSISILVL